MFRKISINISFGKSLISFALILYTFIHIQQCSHTEVATVASRRVGYIIFRSFSSCFGLQSIHQGTQGHSPKHSSVKQKKMFKSAFRFRIKRMVAKFEIVVQNVCNDQIFFHVHEAI